MPVNVALRHQSVYRYDRPVGLSPQLIRLRPAPQTRTPVQRYALNVEPASHDLTWLQDPFGNWQARVVFPEPVNLFRVTVDLIAEIDEINPFHFFVDAAAASFPFAYEASLRRYLLLYLEALPAGPQLSELLRGIADRAPETVAFLVSLNQQLYQRIAYRVRLEPGVQAPEITLETGSGSCRDSAWLLVQLLRHLGLATRFVSGYLIQLQSDSAPATKADHDRADLHAWAEVYLPGAGWVGLDPTSGLLAGAGHIPLSATPEPAESAPITGTVAACEVSFEHHIEVSRLKP